MLDLLNNPSYKAIATDPTTYLEKTTKTLINKSSMEEETKKKVIPREKSSMCPKLYGLPKVHKTGAPLRPIVSSIGSPTNALAKHLASILQPHVEKAASYVKNSQHFIDLIKNIRLEENDILVSFDVTSLFTQVPVDEALSIIEAKYKTPNYLISLAKHCLANTYFTYAGQKYRQVDGAPMGSPLSPALANLYMEDFEIRALNSSTLKPKLWLRYVDDTFVIWQHGDDNLNKFLSHLNQIHPRIKFTMEKEQENQLPFLDVLLKKKQNGALSHTVYRKPTHTNRYLNANSHHHPAQFFSVAKSLAYRSQHLTDKDHYKNEINTLKNVLKNNGYQRKTIEKALNHSQKTERKTETNKIFLPYIKGTTDKIGRVLKRNKIDTIFTTNKKIKDILINPKDKIPLENQGVYEIPCKDCDRSYVGQSNRKISARRDEHMNDVKRKVTTSSLAQHVINTGHNIDFENTKTLHRCENYSKRIIREAIEIEKRPNNLNSRDDSQRLPHTWKHMLENCRIKPNNIIHFN